MPQNTLLRGEGRGAPNVSRLAIWFLLLQAAGTAFWWVLLLLSPGSRSPYLAPGAPDSTLFAFAPADLVFYIVGSVIVAWSLSKRKPWAWPLLCVHAGAIAHSALYGVGLPLFSGGGWGSLMMLPPMVIEVAFVWLLRPVRRNDAGAPQ